MYKNFVDSEETRRVVAYDLEKILFQEIKVLDHGFIRVVDYMGNDTSIVQAARVSYGKGTKKINEDRGLINYLLRHSHTTPFEMCEIKLHIKLPIFIARQWIRHRTASINEYSARYSIMDNEFYVPEAEKIQLQSLTNKQGRESKVGEKNAATIRDIFFTDATKCYDNYSKMLENGIARELARMNLTLNYYTQWYWKINLHNLLHFLKLRADPHAQYEIRAYADKILEIVKKWVPCTYDAFINYKKDSVSLSKQAISMLKKLLNGDNVTFEESKMSKREWNEFNEIFFNK